jgi:uncharacterized membrane protein
MTSLPLHPAIVHLPLGLAFVMPALAAGFAWALWTRRVRSRGAWVAVVALQAVLLGGGLVAMNTGEREEERVERIVPDAAIERHEADAEQFVWAVGLTLVAAVLVVVFRKPADRSRQSGRLRSRSRNHSGPDGASLRRRTDVPLPRRRDRDHRTRRERAPHKYKSVLKEEWLEPSASSCRARQGPDIGWSGIGR